MANITPSAFARKIGLSKQRISVLVKTGTLAPALIKILGKKKPLLNEAKALVILSKSLDSSKKRDGTSSTPYHEAKTAELTARVEKILFETDVKKRKYILKTEVDRQFALMLAVGKERLEAMSIQLSHELATETDLQKVFLIVSKISRRAFYQMQLVAGIAKSQIDGVPESEIKKALAMIEDAPVGKITMAKLYNELLHAVFLGLEISSPEELGFFDLDGPPADWSIKRPGPYDSPFHHDGIIYDVYSIFARLRRTLLDKKDAIKNEDILPLLTVSLIELRNEIEKRIAGEGSNIGKRYQELLKSGARPYKPGENLSDYG